MPVNHIGVNKMNRKNVNREPAGFAYHRLFRKLASDSDKP